MISAQASELNNAPQSRECNTFANWVIPFYHGLWLDLNTEIGMYNKAVKRFLNFFVLLVKISGTYH